MLRLGRDQRRWKCRSCGELYPGTHPTACNLCGGFGFMRPDSSDAELLGTDKSVTLGAVLSAPPPPRLSTGIEGLDRVLGGGLSRGGVVLLGGEPGSGKSSVYLEMMIRLAQRGISGTYGSAEETLAEVLLRAKRFGAAISQTKSLRFLGNDASLGDVLTACSRHRPRVVVVDSISTYTVDGVMGEPGGVVQLKAVTQRIRDLAKRKGHETCVLAIGHVNKDNALAGPKVVEHLVDTVLHFTVTPDNRRVIRTGKNRLGPSGEIAVFDMRSDGLHEVDAGGTAFLQKRDRPEPGSVVFVAADGARPVLLDIDARLSDAPLPPDGSDTVPPALFAPPRLVASGFDLARLRTIAMALQQDADIDLRGRDLFVEVSTPEGDALKDPGIDLAVALAVVSASKRHALPNGLVAFGSVRLNGQTRVPPRPHERLEAALAAGFRTALVPSGTQGLKGETLEALPHLRDLPAWLEKNGVRG